MTFLAAVKSNTKILTWGKQAKAERVIIIAIIIEINDSNINKNMLVILLFLKFHTVFQKKKYKYLETLTD